MLAALSSAGSAWAGQVNAVLLDQGATGTRAEIALQGAGQYRTLALGGPDRLVLDLPDSSAVRGLKLPAPAGVVTAIRTGQPVAGTFRIVFELAAPVAALPLRMERSSDGARLLIEWPGDGPVSAPSATAHAPSVAAPVPVAAPPTAASTVATTVASTAATSTTAVVLKDPREDAARAAALLNAGTAAAPVTPAPRLPASNPPTLPAPAAGSIATRVEPAPVAVPPPAVTAPPPLPRPAISAAGMRPLIVAIDAGHGGQDPGAVGPTGKREKDVTLAMARELARQINATPGLKAFLVRDSDVFIPLPSRAQRARAAKADIFVSLHADAAENRSARGSSVYVLSTKGASSQRARWLADKENAADLVGGVRLQQTENVLAGVLLDLAQSGHMRASEDAANHVLGGLKRVGNNHKPNIERANFAVLRTSDMPAMLVETAFISNAEEEKRLTDPAYQRKVAGAVVDGINTYFTRQPPPGTLFAARAEAESLAMAGGAGGTP